MVVGVRLAVDAVVDAADVEMWILRYTCIDLLIALLLTWWCSICCFVIILRLSTQ